ncbi:MAG: hypothetical protein QM726_02070 [Chitinophagaceae bacterium]
MTSETLQDEMREAIPLLLKMARDITWNKISDNCKFILTEIIDSSDNFHIQRQKNKKENDKKKHVSFSEIMLPLQKIYDNLYDINLCIYKAKRNLTIIDIRYYPKSSLHANYRREVSQKPPMIHCKVATPPWLNDKNEKFDINWEHYASTIKWKLFWARRKFKKTNRLT